MAPAASPQLWLMTAAILALFLAGLTQMGLGMVRLGNMVKFIPFPVVAGFANGFVLIIIARQAPLLFGFASYSELWQAMDGQRTWDGWTLAVGLLAALATWKSPPRLLVPPVFVGLLVGSAASAMIVGLLAPSAHIPMIGALPDGLPFRPQVGSLWAFVQGMPVASVMWPIVETAITLAIVASVQSLLSAAAADSLSGMRRDNNMELVRQGASNMASALVGGTSSGGSPLYTRIAFANGGRTHRVNLVLAALLLAVALAFNHALAHIPVSVMAGVAIVSIAATIDDWTRHLLRALGRSDLGGRRWDLAANFSVVMVVAALVAFANVILALAVGMVLSLLLYIWRASGAVVRRIADATNVHSQTARSTADLALLEENGKAITLLDLQGPIFFGSAEHLARQVDAVATTTETVILNLKRVIDIDSTGALTLKRIDHALAKAGCTLLLAGLAPAAPLRLFLRDIGFAQPEAEGRIFDDVGRALTLAEDRLLAKLKGAASNGETEMELADHPSLRNMTGPQIDLLSMIARRREFLPDQPMVTEGDISDCLYLLVCGKATVVKRHDNGQSSHLGSFGKGAMLGEMALITGERRSADVIAATAVVCYEIAAGELAMLDSIESQISATLLRTIALELTGRVRKLTAALAEAER